MITSPASAAITYTGGHADVGVNYDEGQWEFHFHAEGADIDGLHDVHGEFAPDEIVIRVPNHALGLCPAGAQWNFLGVAAGQPLWSLPQHAHDHGQDDDDDHDMPFLGIGAEELAAGIFVNDQVTLTLAAVVGPGHFSLWQTDSFGDPVVYMSTADPDSTVPLLLTAGAHGHFNWGFTAEGVYEITVLAEGRSADGSLTSGLATYTFHVVPEPATLFLLALGVSLAGRRRAR
jgi:surface-anchored protein